MADAWLAEAERRKTPGGPKAAREPIRATLRQGGKACDCDVVPRPGGFALRNCACQVSSQTAGEPAQPKAQALASRAAIEAEVERKAETYREQHAGCTIEAARAHVYLSEPRYMEAWHAAPAELPVPDPEPARFAEPPAATAVWDRITARARERQAAEPRLTLEQATSKVLSERPELYSEYLAANGGR